MPIFYSCIRVDPRTTIEHASRGGTYGKAAHAVSDIIDASHDRRASYSTDNVVFHVQVAGRVIFIAVCDPEFKQLQAFTYLKKIREAYQTNKGPHPHSSLGAVLKREMENFNSGKGDKLQALQQDIESVRGIMLENVDQLLERGEKINVLVAETEQLNEQSDQFFHSSRDLKRAMWWKNVKIMLLIALVLIIVIFVIVLIACGGFDFHKCKSDKKKDN